MKKETFNLVVRFLVGLALSLLICAGMIMTGKLGSDKPLLQQASGLKGTETVMTASRWSPGSTCIWSLTRPRTCPITASPI